MTENAQRDMAHLTSLDTGETVFLSLESGYEERTFGTNTLEERTIQFSLESISKNGATLSVEEQIALLKKFTRKVQGKGRAHILLYSYNSNSFRCVLRSCQLRNDRGGILILKNMPR